MGGGVVQVRFFPLGARNTVFFDDRGFTTAGMAVALLLALSLVFTASQIYRVNSVSARVQDVADAAALAAEGQVAEYVLAACVCDAVLFSLSVAGLTCAGAGIVCLCVPGGAVIGDPLIEASRSLFDSRSKFCRSAKEGLESYQKALPFLASLRATAIASSNNQEGRHRYLAIAVLVPCSGEPMAWDDDIGSSELSDDIDRKSDGLKQAAERADEEARKANDAKTRGFIADCGSEGCSSMFERASVLAGLDGNENPLYASVDTWDFAAGLSRARAYYRKRLANEHPVSSTDEERMKSYLRSCFYRYAVRKLSSAFVKDTDEGFEVSLPHVPHNTDEVRATSLYTDELFLEGISPEGQRVVFAYPEAAVGLPTAPISLQRMEAEGIPSYPEGLLSVSDMGRVAAASTSIDNGFEHYFREFVEAAEEYERARKKLDPLEREAKQTVDGVFSKIRNALEQVASARITPLPPGRNGAIAIVTDVEATSVSRLAPAPFVGSDSFLGNRTAVAASTLLEESSDEGKTALSSLLDGVAERSGSSLLSSEALMCWSDILRGYAKGKEGMASAVEGLLASLPLGSASGLGDWAANGLSLCIESVGLDPPKLNAVKPVVVNSGSVAASSDDPAAVNYISIKKAAIEHPVAGSRPFSSLISAIEGEANHCLDGVPETVEVASIEIAGAGIPIEVPVPDSVRDSASTVFRDALDRLRGLEASECGGSVWD